MITVPQGGTVAGRSADIRIERPDIGGFVANEGAAVQEKMTKIVEQQRAVKYSQTELAMTKELGTEYQRVAQLTDPAQIETEWPQVEAAIRDKYVNAKDENGNPLLTPEEADALGLQLGGLSVKHGFNLGARSIELTQGQTSAAWIAARTDIVNQAATADPDTMDAFLDFGEAQIEAVARQTGKDAAWVETEKQAFRAEAMNARAITALDQDPLAFIAAANNGVYDALGGERKAQLMVTAQAEADRRAAAEAKLAEADAKAETDAVTKRLKEITTIEGKGLKVVDRDFVVNAPDAIKALPEWAEAMSSIQLNDEIPTLDLMTLKELDAQIAAEEGRTYEHDWQASRLTVLRAKREKLAAEVATDPKTAAIDRGVIAPQGDLTFDPADPDGFAAALAEAVSNDTHLREKGYVDGNRSAVFTRDQKDALKAVLAPGADAGPKVALMGAILEGTQGNASAVLADLEADPVSRRALKVLGVTRDPGLTEAILRGGQKLDGKTVVPPSRKEQVLAFDAMTGGVFNDVPALKAELMEAALALYADGANGIDGETTSSEGWISDGEAYELYQQSVQRLLGAQTDRNGAFTVGGLQEVNGGLTVLPVGVAVQDVEATWEKITDDLAAIDPAWYDTRVQLGPDFDPNDDTVAQRLDAAYAPFAAASTVAGELPDLGKDPAGRMGTLTLHRVGESDIYELVREQNGRLTPIPAAGKDYAYRFRLKDLMRGTKP